MIYPASREAVIAHSRSQYGRPRDEVERQIVEQMGWDPIDTPTTPEETERLEVKNQLLAIGVSKEEAASLIDRFAIENIRQQIEWLPFRGAKSRSRYLIAAIEGNYQAPASARQNHEEVTTEQGEELMEQPQGQESLGS